MQIKKTLHKKSSRKLLYVTAIVVGIILLGYGIFAYATNSWPFNSIQKTIIQNKSQSDEAGDVKQTPDNSTGQPTGTDKSPTNKTPTQYDTPQGEKIQPNTLTGIINYKNISDGILTIRNTIDQKITDGNCKLVLTNKSTGKTITQTADILANPSSSTCKGFSVSTTKLSSGIWDITITITSGDQKGVLRSSVNI
ncbi:MAG TPA: hypothetical protein PLZ58_00935 [Candidatus Saccharibacteria bacterium]|nr:hypothetical protein [Candidatus Saccharibacteria bacterium]HRQ07114.1 hypothetical protein [Candidatus Saccharibacteria bacterium]